MQIVGKGTVAALFVLGACAEAPSGNLNLVLTLPGEGDLRPEGMTMVAVAVRTADGSESVTTTPLDGTRFSAGEVKDGLPIFLSVQLRDIQNTLVGFGSLDEPFTPTVSEQEVTIAVRKPIVYVATGGAPHTIDTTRDALDPKYQGSMSSLTDANLIVPIDGTEVAVMSSTGLTRVATADHLPVGPSVNFGFGTVLDAAAVPGQRKLAVATTMGLVVFDIESGLGTMRPLSPGPSRVAIGGGIDTGFTVYLLQNRVAAPTGTGACTGSSQVVAFSLENPTEQAAMVAMGAPISDIAAAGPAVFGSNPCAGQVRRLDAGTPAVMMGLTGASVLAVEGGRLWGAGSLTGPGGAQILLGSINLDGSGVQQVRLPPKAEVATYDFDDKKELSINMHADTNVALDLAVLPSSQQVALITRMDAHRAPRGDGLSVVIPEMDMVVHDLIIADTSNGSVVQRIRSKCTLNDHFPNNAEFPRWSCIAITAPAAPTGGEMTPLAVGALYGGR
ncbi:MAG: hypothetical protein KF773_33275 [Deltaproteobacteria bacterium]|nr:hypothetical protein [Deltaproteobacteria bacterium]MCW5808473.1 hypothetical protein [Deltaproteobacteria bacterium]